MTVPAPRTASCPNCGAPVQFRWAQAVQTTCAYCRTVLVRMDLDLARVGTQAEFPATGSPIQLGTEGRWRQRSFVVVGRITYQWARGRWNEWHCILNDGASAWLSDAQLDYAMSQATPFGRGAPDIGSLQVGDVVFVTDDPFRVSNVLDAQYVGTEGELPFATWERRACRFVDLQSTDGRFATIDGTEAPPLLFVGEYVSFDVLDLRNLREFDGWGPAR